MIFSWRRMNAIFMKDYKDFSRNMAVSIVVFMVPVLAAFYGRIGAVTIDAQFMLFNMAFTMVAAFIQSCLIAEEKDKNTLRGLMLSPATTAEILVGKSLLSFILTALVIVLSAFFTDYSPKNIWIVSIAIFISICFYIAIGTLLGLYAKSVMEASVIVLPVMLVFTFGTFVTNFIEQYPILKILNIFPNVQLVDLAKKVQSGAGMGDVWTNMSLIFIWLIITSILTMIVYRRKMVD